MIVLTRSIFFINPNYMTNFITMKSFYLCVCSFAYKSIARSGADVVEPHWQVGTAWSHPRYQSTIDPGIQRTARVHGHWTSGACTAGKDTHDNAHWLI